MSDDIIIKKIPKNLILDVDGVLTDGTYHYTIDGKVAKIFGPDDNDALCLLKKYLTIHMVSGDKRGFDITKKRIDDMKFPIDLVSTFDRLKWITDRFNPEETIYMGDGIFDASIFNGVMYGIAPANAFITTKQHANYVTPSRGADSAVAEACLHILEKFFEPFDPLNLNVDSVGVWQNKK
ncbi:HAD hydrolase family protein [Candidatus Falkowbacteria bacterium]|uniref:Phosphatase n=1 Tax=Candidatus Buchananbacteria bacterium CG10_big_fil_rev_8_21_14_0_10_33_19 TaxID=1974525 RepID=A0A2H0W3I4_9BACT|nr:HAD hydrolase family protein [Candidatus Falkowbacteria bacterium]PIS05837.1 MAG: phosphatase [Candidatus Buchananbacteria bacterium CG10_big_fil_rev_8_21_14_0_10_33_19]